MPPTAIGTYVHLSILVTLGNVCAYAVQLLLARSLTPADFGAINALLSLAMVISAPFAVIPMVISKLLLANENEATIQAHLVRRFYLAGLAITAAFWVVNFPFASGLSRLMNVSVPVATMLLPVLVASTVLYLVPIGIWQSRGNYAMMAVGTAAVPILRFVFAFLLVTCAGAGLLGAIWSLTLAGLIVFGAGAWAQHDKLSATPTKLPIGTIRRAIAVALPGVVGMLGLLGLAYVDQPIVRSLSSAEASGQYAAAATLAKIALLLPSALTGFIFPEAAKLTQSDEASQQASLRLIVTVLLFTVAVSGAATMAMLIAPRFILVLLAGHAYGGAAPLLMLLAPAMTFLAIITVLVTYALARDRFDILWPTIIALAVALTAPYLLRLDANAVATMMFWILGLLCAICLAWLFMTHRPRK